MWQRKPNKKKEEVFTTVNELNQNEEELIKLWKEKVFKQTHILVTLNPALTVTTQSCISIVFDTKDKKNKKTTREAV